MRTNFYDKATGEIHPAEYSGPDDFIGMNTPPGCLPITGVTDAMTQRVDLEALAARQAAIDDASARVKVAQESLFAATATDEHDKAQAELIAARVELDAALALPVLVDYQPPAPADTDLVTHSWNGETKRWVAEPTLAAKVAAESAAAEISVQAQLDAVARSWGYDSLLSAASYAASAVPQFKAEAAVLIAWRDATWSAAYALQAAVKAGTVQTPASTEELLAVLPAVPTRP